MRLVPRNTQPQITFFLTHLEPWAEHAEALGTTAEMVATLADQTEAARVAREEQQQAQQATAAATLRLRMAADAMASTGAAIISQIRARASTEGNGVYELALIRRPAAPSPIGKPGKPADLEYALDARGALALTWKCKHPRGAAGTMYQVSRRIEFDGPFVPLGTCGTKRFIDETIPAGASQIVYQIRAIRSTGAGPAATFNVNFGTSSAGGMPASVNVKQQSAKIAA